jgi:hypothetical protein
MTGRRERVGKEEVAPVSSEEENKALVRRFFEEVWSKGNLAVVDEILAPEFVDRSLLPGQGSSREDYKRSITEFRTAFSFAHLTIEHQITSS